ncbi:16918_t:CDS:2, partial [Cetraspora pellucida]
LSVDKSAIIHRAKDIVEENKLDNVITGRVEDVVLPVQKVDIIISEWMGYFLFFEGMLDSLIVARDRLLAPDGIIAPSHCRLLFAAIEDELFNDTFNFWNDVYGTTSSQLDFTSPFTLEISRNGTVYGFLGYFDEYTRGRGYYPVSQF